MSKKRLTRDEVAKVLIYKGPATAYKEDVVEIAIKKGYRLVDSRFLTKAFTSKMQGLEKVSDKKMMFIEGKDVNFFTAVPKAQKLISKTQSQRAIESSEAVAKAVSLMSEIVGGGTDVATIGKTNDASVSKIAELQTDVDALNKAKNEALEDVKKATLKATKTAEAVEIEKKAKEEAQLKADTLQAELNKLKNAQK